MIQSTNLLENLPSNNSKEIFETILQNKNIKIERIISNAEVTPEGKWYNQEEDEFVILLEGEAKITFTSGNESHYEVALTKNSYLHIPAKERHRVSYVSKDALWLAIFFKN